MRFSKLLSYVPEFRYFGCCVLYLLVPIFAMFVTWMLWRKLTKYPPGPFPVPFCGNYFTIKATKPLRKILENLHRRFGPVFSLSLFRENVNFVNGYELIHEALNQKSEAPICRAQGLIVAPGKKGGAGRTCPEWKKFRQFTTASLLDLTGHRYGIEERMLENIQNMTEELIASMEQPMKMRNVIERAVLHTLCDIIFGVKFNSDDQQFLQLHSALNTLTASPVTSFPDCVRLYYPFIPICLQTPAPAISIQEAEQSLQCLVQARLTDHQFGIEMRKPRDLIDLFVKKAQKSKNQTFSDAAIVTMICDTLKSSFQTTSACILWCLVYLLKYPDIQESCRLEIMEKVGSEHLVLLKDRDMLLYIQSFICEVQRVASIEALSLPYRTKASLTLAEFIITQGSVLLFNIQSSHMDSTYWKRPSEFRPSRFIDIDGNLVKHDAFLPFGLGAMSCPGEQLATNLIFLMVTNVLRRFKLLLPVGDPAPSTERDDINLRQPLPFCMCAVSSRL